MNASLTQAIEDMRNMRESYDQIGAAAEAYNTGKAELAANINAKGVQASATETLPELAEKVSAISQDTYEIDGGEMYAKQLFGALDTPNYWNLYDIMAQLLSDGRLVNYGGILLAEYYKGYDSLELVGAGAGGAYVVSDKDGNGNFIMYTEDTTHIWNTAFDGKGNRWVAYCFADEAHSFQITDTNTCPRSIHIGRHVGVIKSLVAGRIGEIVVTDGNILDNFIGGYAQQWNKHIVLRNLASLTESYNIYWTQNNQQVESIYAKVGIIDGGYVYGNINTSTPEPNIKSMIIEADEIRTPAIITAPPFDAIYVFKANKITAAGVYRNADLGKGNSILVLESPYIRSAMVQSASYQPKVKNLFITTEDCELGGSSFTGGQKITYVKIDYITNDRTKSVMLAGNSVYLSLLTDLEIKDGWCKPLNISTFTHLTEENIVNHILNKLGDNSGQSPLTITLGATNLAKLTAEEKSIATNKGFILA